MQPRDVSAMLLLRFGFNTQYEFKWIYVLYFYIVRQESADMP